VFFFFFHIWLPSHDFFGGEFLLCRISFWKLVPLKKKQKRSVHNLYDYVTLLLARALHQVVSIPVTLGHFVICDSVKLSHLSSFGIRSFTV